MQLELNLKMRYPTALLGSGWNRRVRVMRALGFRPPFVLPWSSPIRMSGAAISESGITVAHGGLIGHHYQADSVTRIAGTNLMLGIFELNRHEGEPVCVGLPRERTLVRHFKVPSESESEIQAMLPHLLANELPMSLEHYSWVWAPLSPLADGQRLISVYIAKNDGLADFLDALDQVGFNLVGLVPEGWAWAHAIREFHRDDEVSDDVQPRSVIVRGDAGPYLVVEQSGHLLFDAQLAPSALGEGPLDWESTVFTEVRQQFQDLLNFPLPKPDIWPDALGRESEEPKESLFFGASVAACGIEHRRLMVPATMLKRNRRRVFLKTLAVLGRLSLIAALAWVAFVMIEDRQALNYLDGLNRQISEERPGIETLESELKAIREDSRERAEHAQILRAMASLRRNLKKPIYLEHLNYVHGRGITLRGGAPSSRLVLEMTDKLAMDPLWKGLRVTQLRSEEVNRVNQVHFVIEGQLD